MSVSATSPTPPADRSDEELLDDVKALADRLGRRPGRDAVIRELGVGAGRAKRLLEAYDRQTGRMIAPVPSAADRSDDQEPTGREPDSTTIPDRSEGGEPTGRNSGGRGGRPVDQPDRSGSVSPVDHAASVGPTTPTGTPDRPAGEAAPTSRPGVDQGIRPTGPVEVGLVDRSDATTGGHPLPVGNTIDPTAVDRLETVETTGQDTHADRSGNEPTGGQSTGRPTSPVASAMSGLLTAAISRAADRIASGPRSDRSTDQPDAGEAVLSGWHIAAALLIAIPAFLAVWSGWIGLGELTGWGKRNMLPGLVKEGGWATINTSITLPIGVEAFGALSLSVFLASRHRRGLLRFYSGLCAFGSILLGCFGQIAYHVLTATSQKAPNELVAFVAMLPPLVLAAAAGLIHLAASDRSSH